MQILTTEAKNIFTDSDTFEILGLLIGILTLILAFIVSRKSIKNHLKTKQIDHVCSLIEYLNSTKISISFSTYKGGGAYVGTGHGVKFNIFEIGKYEELESKGFNLEFEDERVLFNKKCNQIFDIGKYIDSPLTPRGIADELLNFYNSQCFILRYEEIVEDADFIEIESDVMIDSVIFNKKTEGALISGNAIAFASWLNLKEYSKNLKKIIGQWLIENGIKENNIRQDFKN